MLSVTDRLVSRLKKLIGGLSSIIHVPNAPLFIINILNIFMSTQISLENLKKEHARIKAGIESGKIKVTHHGSALSFLKSHQEIK